MKKSFNCFFVFLLFSNLLLAQTWSSAVKPNQFKVRLRVNTDSSVNFVYSLKENIYYGEYTGSIKKVTDSIYHVSAQMAIGQFIMKAFNDQYFYIKTDTAIARQLSSITFKYNNGKVMAFFPHAGPATNENYIRLPYKKEYFNAKKGFNFLRIQLNIKGQLDGQKLVFKIPFGSAISLVSGADLEFDLEAKKNTFQTIGVPPAQTGHFVLKRSK